MPGKAKKYKHERFKYLVNIEWSEEDHAYLARVPELRGLVTHGESIEQAAHRATEAIGAWIEAAHESGVKIPDPVTTRSPSGRFVTRIDPETHRHLLIEAKRKGKTLNGVISEILNQAVA